MKKINIDKEWTFRRGLLDSIAILQNDPGVVVNLPHDGMIETPVSADVPATVDSGYFDGDVTNYTKYLMIPKEWEQGCVGLSFDGVMLNATVDVNGCKVGLQHYGYAPFYLDITDYVTYGEENRITVNTNTSMQPNSRWYTGSGIYRSLSLCHGPKIHIAEDGIYLYTKEVSDGIAFIEGLVDISNATNKNHIVEVVVSLCEEGSEEVVAGTRRVIQVNSGKTESAHVALHLNNPRLWDIDTPNLYTVKASVRDLGEYRTHLNEKEAKEADEAFALFGVRTITADSVRGLRINGKTVKLKGGCLHHDNGLLGSVSLYESEARKVLKLKEIGFNAIRTAHNPPSAALIEACDRLGMYVFDEAFDAWGMAKRAGDYSLYFDTDWEKDLTAFVRRDRIHPCVIMWSTGNEIPERGGLNNGYTLATKLANKVRSLDASRLISNGICSYWSGLDDYQAQEQSQTQNANGGLKNDIWEQRTEPFTNGLDVVGYNYLEEFYERDHELYPERVILGSENFPKEIGYRWPFVENHDYVIGEFTWTAWDYIGEAGIGKSIFVEEGDPLIEKGPWAVMPMATSPYPWRTANDADYDITGLMKPQGAYRKVVWGDKSTYLFTQHPANYNKIEVIGMWGFIDVNRSWDYPGYEDKDLKIVVFSSADEVELLLDGKIIDRKPVDKASELPNSVWFETKYAKGKLEAVSFKDGVEVSRDCIESAGYLANIKLVPEKTVLKADGHDVTYVSIELQDKEGRLQTAASTKLLAFIDGPASLAGFGTGNPITEENYTDNGCRSFKGRAMAVIRSGYEKGQVKLSVMAPDDLEIVAQVMIEIV